MSIPEQGRVGEQAAVAPQVSVDAGPVRDAELVSRVAHGDRAAFAALYDRYAPRVFGLATKVVRDLTLAEDVAQDVFVMVWCRAGQYDPARGGVTSWLLTITHRRAVDAVRREQSMRNRIDRVAHLSGSPTLDARDPVADAVGDEAEARRTRARLHDALASLTDLQRSAIELAYFSGLTYQQVARRLGIPLPTAKSRIRDGLRRMAASSPFPLAGP